MRPRWLLIGSAVFWGGFALIYEKEALFWLSLATHAILYQLHGLEVRINKLLDHHQIRMKSEDFEH